MNKERFNKIQADYIYFRQSLEPFYQKVRANNKWADGEPDDVNLKASDNSILKVKSGHLFNAIQYKHADFMDNFPHINILPREESDEKEAKVLSDIVPCILENADFKNVYSKNTYVKLKNGCACYGVFWDDDADFGNGDISVKVVQLDRLAWQPNITNIQDSRCVFYDYFMEHDEFVRIYGEKESVRTQAEYDKKEDDKYDDSGNVQVVVTDCYYKTRDAQGKETLHFIKFSGSEILEESEGKEEYKNGFYEHGRYPFVMDVLHPATGDITGIGIIELGKSQQAYIDKLDQHISEAALYSARPRFFVKEGMAGVNRSQFLDLNIPLVEVSAGSLDENVIRRIEPIQIPGFISEHRKTKIEELKEILGNRDFAQGGTSGGVTAASAITALQNSGDKLSRDMISQSYTAISDVVLLVIELIRQNYNEERAFRITGDDESVKYIRYSNENIKRKEPGSFSQKAAEFLKTFGIDIGSRTRRNIRFDVTLSVEKNNPYQRGQHNQLILTLYQMGLLNPQNAQLGSFIISNLSFDGRDKILEELRAAAEKMQMGSSQESTTNGEELVAVPTQEDASGIFSQGEGPGAGDELVAVPTNS